MVLRLRAFRAWHFTPIGVKMPNVLIAEYAHQGVSLGYGQQLGLQPATINYPCGARINGCGRSAWKALRSEATITGYAVPGGTMRRRRAWKALRHRTGSNLHFLGRSAFQAHRPHNTFPGTSYPVTVATLRTAFQADSMQNSKVT